MREVRPAKHPLPRAGPKRAATPGASGALQGRVSGLPVTAQPATNYLPAGPAGEASVEQVELDAAAGWLAHVRAGRIG